MVTGYRSGGDVGRAIERAVDGVRRQIEAQIAGMRDLDAQVTELVERRGQALLELSKHYLPDIQTATVSGAFVEVRDDLAAILADKNRRERDLADQVAAAQRQVDQEEAELHRVTEALDAKVVERERLEQQVAERLHGSDEFKRLSAQALVAEAELRQNEDRVSEMQQQAAKKLPSYDGSRLFRYLYDCGYGTPKYQGTGFAKTMDAWVAKLIKYHDARRSYDFLRVTPELMAAEVSRRRDAFNELMEQVEAIEDRVSDEIGLTAVMREGQELGAERDRLVAAAAKAHDEIRKLEEAALRLAGTQNEFYDHAIARMRNFLANVPPHELESHARTTPERQDDAIVAEVRFLNERLDEAQRNGTSLDRERGLWNARLAGLQQVLEQFRAAEFDAQRSQFPARFDVEGLVAQFVEGSLSAADLWAAIRGSQEFAPQWHEQPPRGGGRGWTDDIRDVVTSDASIMLLRVLAEVAGQAMRNNAYRGVKRRAPTRQQKRQSEGRPTFKRNRGFTNGRGF